MKIVINILIKTICVVLFLFLSLYIGLWIYVIKSVPDELKQQYEQNIVYDFSEEQYKIMWFTLTENKNYRLKWYPFMIEFLFKGRRNNIDTMTSSFILFSNEKYIEAAGRLPTWNIEYGLVRYIRKKDNYKKCLSIIINTANMGKEIYGIENACKYYYEKSFNDLTEKELISLILLIYSPTRYEIGSIISENKINEIINKYNK